MSVLRRSLAVALVVSLLVASAPAVAQESASPGDEEILALLEQGVALYNQNVEQLDIAFAENLIGGKTVNVYVDDGGDERVFSAVVGDDMRVSDVRIGPNPAASTRISTDRATLESFADAEDPLGEVRQAVRDDRIRVAGEKGHPVDQVVWTVANLFKGFVL